MALSKPRILRTRLYKTCGSIERIKFVHGKISSVHNILGLNYGEPKETDSHGDPVEFKLDFKCNICSSPDSNAENDGELKASVEIILTVMLDHYSPEYLNDVILSAWPYLRTAAQVQLQILGLGQNADQLPYQVTPVKPHHEKK